MAGREVLAGACKNDHPDLRIVGRPQEGVVELGQQ
jgi:hypothetical protein